MKKPFIYLMTTTTALLGTSGPHFAQTVELRANDGSTTVSGELISTKGGKYTLRTSIGVVSFEEDLFACSGAACPVDENNEADLSVAGPSELVDVILPLLADGFAEEQEIEAQAIGSNGLPLGDRRAFEKNGTNSIGQEYFNIRLTDEEGGGQENIHVQEASGQSIFDLLISNDADIVFSEATANERNIREARRNGVGDLSSFDQERILAVDGFTGVVNPNNSIEILTVSQISDIMSGNIRNWKNVGGRDHEIKLYTLSENTEAFHVISGLVLDPFGENLRPDVTVVGSNRELSRAIESDEFGFGIVSFSSIRNAKPVSIESECGIVISPNNFSMKSEEYILQNRVTAYSADNVGELGDSFIEYLDHPSVDDIISKAGLISLSVVEEDEEQKLIRLRRAVQTIDPAVPASMLQQLVSDTLDTRRLSTTLRFSPQSSVLDNKARRDIRRILRFIEDQNLERVILAGFADSDGSFEQNSRLSLARANTVRQELEKLAEEEGFDTAQLEVRGYSELAPVACNTTLSGRATNRRVEVWAE